LRRRLAAAQLIAALSSAALASIAGQRIILTRHEP
jgi:hypothetical protein